MTAAVATRPAARSYFAADIAAATWSGHQIDDQADGTIIVRGVEVFRSGTFRDSMGVQSTWEDIHLQQMAMHFTLLRDNGILPNVPVRRDHSRSIDKVMGYFHGDPYVKNGKLVVDLHITDVDQIPKFRNGTFRSRSLEVGSYVTNDEAEYWPVVWGVAYVDIPAVEGLHNVQMPDGGKFFSRADDTEPPTKETPVTAPDDRGAQRPSTFRINGVDTGDAAAVQSYINDLEKRPSALAVFTIGGAQTSDQTMVQAHIDALEGFAKETREATRQDFVEQIAKDGKIPETMKAFYTKQAAAMDDAAFAEFKSGFEAAPVQRLFAEHGAQSGGDPAANKGEAASERVVLEEQIEQFRRAGLPADQIAKTPAAIKLAQMKD